MWSPRDEVDCPLLEGASRPRSPTGIVNGLRRIRLRPKLRTLFCIAVVSVTVVAFRAASGSSLVDLTRNWMSQSKPESPPHRPLALPTGRFRDALNPDERYITSWITAGWTNDVIALIHMIQIALHTGRIPILPPFQPSHAPGSAGFIKFSEVFSIPRLSESLNITILEWSDMKNTHSDNPPFAHYEDYYGGEVERLGCWSLWMTQMAGGQLPRGGRIPEALSLEVSYLPIPFGYKHRYQLELNIHSLSSLSLPSARELAIAESKETYMAKMQETIDKLPEARKPKDAPTVVPIPSTGGAQIDPEDHVLCFDFLYFTTPYVEGHASLPEFDPDWVLVGKYMRFTESLMSLATEFLLHVLSLSAGTPLPPLITVHIRRQDWVKNCRTLGVPVDECLAPLSAYARRVEEVRADMLDAHPEWTTDNIKVMVLSDEPRTTTTKSIEKYGFAPGSSEAWWESIRAQKSFSVDHDAFETIKKYGEWYPIILDACILSMGHGFVGTDVSTYSRISGERVREWQDGPIRTVKWGKKGADDH